MPGVFLDISKAFGIWFIYKLRRNSIPGNLLNLLEIFQVIENKELGNIQTGQCKCWTSPRFDFRTPFIIYINHFPETLQSTRKLFADDTSLFLVIKDPNSTAEQRQLNRWAFPWKGSFNLDHPKQAKEVIFSRRDKNINHPPIYFNDTAVTQVSQQKHLGLILDISLSFEDHMKTISSKLCKTVGLLRILNKFLTRWSVDSL